MGVFISFDLGVFTMAQEIKWSNFLRRDKLRILKHQMRKVSPMYYTADQTSTVAADIYSDFVQGNVQWEQVFDLSEYLVKHSYTQSYEDVQGDAYAQLCAFGQYEQEQAHEQDPNKQVSPTGYSSRRVVSAVCCHTVEIPDSVYDKEKNVNKADVDAITFYVVGDAWLSLGCYVAVFASNDETPPSFGELVDKMNTPGAEKMGENCWAGYVGADYPTDPGAIRYLRTNILCETGSQSSRPSEWQGVKEKLIFKIHDWAINDYDPTTGTYDVKKYLHVMLFLTKNQYVDTRDSWIEGSAIINLSTVGISFTQEVEVPSYIYDLCPVGRDDSAALGSQAHAIDLTGGVFSLVNIFKMTDYQAAPLLKNNAEACVFSAIESAIDRIGVPNAVYGFRKYPPVTSHGFDFYTVGVDGGEFVRIGCIDENAMFNTNVPMPSVYGLVIGYPVNPGFAPRTYDRIILTSGTDYFSGCVRLQVVIYHGFHDDNVSTDGQSYGFGTNIDRAKFDAKSFFSGKAGSVVLDTSERISLSKLYYSYHTEIYEGQEFVFGNEANFKSPGFIMIGVSPVDFSKTGTMSDGEWGQYMSPEYGSQYMQLVDWPISQTVKVQAIE